MKQGRYLEGLQVALRSLSTIEPVLALFITAFWTSILEVGTFFSFVSFTEGSKIEF